MWCLNSMWCDVEGSDISDFLKHRAVRLHGGRIAMSSKIQNAQIWLVVQKLKMAKNDVMITDQLTKRVSDRRLGNGMNETAVETSTRDFCLSKFDKNYICQTWAQQKFKVNWGQSELPNYIVYIFRFLFVTSRHYKRKSWKVSVRFSVHCIF